MPHTRRTLLLTALSTVAIGGTVAATAGRASAAYPDPGTVTGDVAAHDPTMIKTNGEYVVYSTHNGCEARTSTDRIAFSRNGSAFPSGVSWASSYSGDPMELWAPDISYHGGKYLLYYAASSFGSNTSAIGLAGSSTGLPGSWTDYGEVISSSSSDDYNAIDPNLFVDSDGKWWLQFGSFWSGIQQVQLDPSTGKPASGATVKNIASRGGGAIEAAYLWQHGSYYYLFVSFDLCCQGVNSTYRIMVGRSTSANGPFADRNGTAMLSGGGTEILATHGNVIGPGGQSVYADTDHDLLVYHYYDGANNGAVRLGINYLGYDSSGWPYVY
jgi:arabinan endo-1,5-alpha-L-arabinosidase